jgi:hypothetical protein
VRESENFHLLASPNPISSLSVFFHGKIPIKKKGFFIDKIACPIKRKCVIKSNGIYNK